MRVGAEDIRHPCGFGGGGGVESGGVIIASWRVRRVRAPLVGVDLVKQQSSAVQ